MAIKSPTEVVTKIRDLFVARLTTQGLTPTTTHLKLDKTLGSLSPFVSVIYTGRTVQAIARKTFHTYYAVSLSCAATYEENNDTFYAQAEEKAHLMITEIEHLLINNKLELGFWISLEVDGIGISEPQNINGRPFFVETLPLLIQVQ